MGLRAPACRVDDEVKGLPRIPLWDSSPTGDAGSLGEALLPGQVITTTLSPPQIKAGPRSSFGWTALCLHWKGRDGRELGTESRDRFQAVCISSVHFKVSVPWCGQRIRSCFFSFFLVKDWNCYINPKIIMCVCGREREREREREKMMFPI